MREFARDHLPFATIPVPRDASRRKLLWWGRDAELTRLRQLGEQIAQERQTRSQSSMGPKGSAHLLFADCAGLEEDWFRFV